MTDLQIIPIQSNARTDTVGPKSSVMQIDLTEEGRTELSRALA